MSLTSLRSIKEPPLKDEQYSIKERAGEIGELEKERDILAKEVKKLSDIFFRLQEGEKVVRKNVEGITTERLSVISGISKQISSELKDKSTKLEKKSIQLDEREVFLLDLCDYLYAYAQIVEAEKLLVERRDGVLIKRGMDVVKSEKKAEKKIKDAQQRLKKAKSVEKGIDGRYEKADEIARWFENEAEKEKGRIELWAKTVARREKLVASARREIKKVQLKQDDRGVWLMDREEQLSRTMAEIQRREHVILEHGRRKI